MKTFTFFSLVFLSLAAPSTTFGQDLSESPLRPFETDYCTGFPEGTREEPNLWKHCCVEHDLHFWAGGCRNARREADRRIYQCIRDSGAPGIARLMFLGIRLGAMSPFKIQKRKWGNGWRDQRGNYRGLALKDIPLLEAEFHANPSTEVTPEMFHRFLTTLREHPCTNQETIKADNL
jgi:hypothetical protein